MTKWEPIDTAPKDRRILLFVPPRDYHIGQWDDDRYALKKPRPYWTSSLERVMGRKWMRDNPPTHWMEIPPCP
jgi:hypothetical protein